jgi:hypothetical protein
LGEVLSLATISWAARVRGEEAGLPALHDQQTLSISEEDKEVN